MEELQRLAHEYRTAREACMSNPTISLNSPESTKFLAAKSALEKAALSYKGEKTPLTKAVRLWAIVHRDRLGGMNMAEDNMNRMLGKLKVAE